MTLHLRAIHETCQRQSDDRVLDRLKDETTETLRDELAERRPLRWPLPKPQRRAA